MGFEGAREAQGVGDRIAELLTAEAEREEIAGRLSALLCDLTGGRLSKPTYDVPTMVQEIEEHLTRELEIDAEAERDRARDTAARLEQECARLSDEYRQRLADVRDEYRKAAESWDRQRKRLQAALTGPAETGDEPA